MCIVRLPVNEEMAPTLYYINVPLLPVFSSVFSCEYHADCKQMMGLCSNNVITDIDIKGALCGFGE